MTIHQVKISIDIYLTESYDLLENQVGFYVKSDIIALVKCSTWNNQYHFVSKKLSKIIDITNVKKEALALFSNTEFGKELVE